MNNRLAKARLRYLNRRIYCFMCEMKARRELALTAAKDKQPKGEPEVAEERNQKIKDKQLFEVQQKSEYIDRYIRESKLLGLALKDQDQLDAYNLVNAKLKEDEYIFTENTLNATNQFQYNIMSPRFLDCLPDYVITQLDHRNATAVFNSFMRYCPDQNLRQDFWQSYYSRAAPFNDTKVNNILTIEKIRSLRHRKAKIFGYDSFAQMAIDLRASGGTTMAGNVENVRAFIQGLGIRSESAFNDNLKQLSDFATTNNKQAPRKTDLVDQLNLWDLKYYERQYQRDVYNVNSTEVRSYFPLDRVVSGMLDFVENLFKIKIVEIKDDSNGWNKNVKHYKIFNNTARSVEELGSFYFDPFQQESRVFMPIARTESLSTKPVVMFLMNFRPDASTILDQYEGQKLCTGKELLNFAQVVDLFGKFAFVLQHILTEVSYSEIGGLANLEADSFETVSHFMKMWPLNSYETLSKCSCHVQTGQPISKEFFERIRNGSFFSNMNFRVI